MVDNTIIVQGYSPEAIRQLETLYRTIGAGTAADSTNPNGTNANTDAVEENTRSVGTLTRTQNQLTTAYQHMKNVVGGRGLNQLLGEFKSGLAGGVQAMGKQDDAMSSVKDYLGRTVNSFAKLGISLEEFNNFNTSTRAAAINMGGLTEWTNRLTSRQTEYYARIGSNVDAVKHQTEMMNLLVHSGARAEDLYDDFGDRLMVTNDDLLKMGVTYQESREQLQGMMKNENVRQRLMSAADASQRRSIMLEIQERFKNLKMLGMSTDQAKAASEALEALSGKGPLDRIKESAKMQAGLSAMGIANAEEVARIYRKGDRANDQEREVMRKALGRMQEIQAESRTDTFGRELTVEAISTKTGLDNISKVFSEKLDTGAAIQQKQLDAITRIGEESPTFVAMSKGIDTINNFLEKSWIPESINIAKELVKGSTAMAASAGPIALVGGAITSGYQAYKAFTTGESDIMNALTKAYPEATERFSNGVGTFVDSVSSVFGNKEALERTRTLKAANRTEDQKIKAAEKQIVVTQKIAEEMGKNTTSIVALKSEMENSNRAIRAVLEKQVQQLENSNKTLRDQLIEQGKIAKQSKTTLQAKGTPE